MSLVGFKAQNHPQQVAKDDVDDRAIRDEDFAPLRARFGFTVDVAASRDNRKLQYYFDRQSDGLVQSWTGHRVWCNPPYSDIRPWVEKAIYEFELGLCELVVMLLPANRTEQGWWQDLIEPRLRDGRLRVEFLRGRMRFVRPGWAPGPKGDRPPFGCCLLIWSHGAQ